ncbi:hypothetical protein I4U23_027010 [Adineta vaga]|nr:hypothetical protein I4U23_027010 [Adineta vaga]
MSLRISIFILSCIAIMLGISENLKHLSIVVPSVVKYYKATRNYPCLSLCQLPVRTFFSSTLTKLSLNVIDLTDVYALLDGRLKQLTTLIVQTESIWKSGSTFDNSVILSLINLKCFSLTCNTVLARYDFRIEHLLRRMLHLEELTLFLDVLKTSPFIYGTYLNDEILIHMSHLQTFIFYIECMDDIDNDFSVHVSADDIKQIAFFHFRLARAFPFLKKLTISNMWSPFWSYDEFHLHDKDWCSIIEYPFLSYLDMTDANTYYLEHFLNETKTHLPCLSKLKVDYDQLEMVTNNFTKDEIRRTYSTINEFSFDYPIDHLEVITSRCPSLAKSYMVNYKC